MKEYTVFGSQIDLANSSVWASVAWIAYLLMRDTLGPLIALLMGGVDAVEAYGRAVRDIRTARRPLLSRRNGTQRGPGRDGARRRGRQKDDGSAFHQRERRAVTFYGLLMLPQTRCRRSSGPTDQTS